MLATLLVSFPAIDPVALTLGPFQLRWYALAYIAAFVFATWYMKRLVSTPALWAGTKPTATPEQIDALMVWAIIGVIAGGRLGYVLFYDPLRFVQNPLEIVKLWEGGMSFHGGFLGVAVAALVFGRRIGAGLDRMLDLGAACVPVGLGLGRIANFINAELWGRATDVPWAMVFPTDPDRLPRHPSQLYEALIEGLILFLAVRFATHRHAALARPGLASGIFALLYGLGRIFVELFREPDRHIGYLWGAVTMGMVLSLPLVAVGAWLLLRARKRG